MAKNRILYGLYLAAVVIFHSFYTGWFSFYLLIFSLVLPLFSLLVSLRAMRQARCAAELPLRCDCGARVQYRLEPQLQGRYLFPRCCLQLQVHDFVGGQTQPYRVKLGGTTAFTLPVDTRHAGCQSFAVSRGYVYDALCLFRVRLPLPPCGTIAVEPAAAEPAVLPNLGQFQFRSYHPKPGGGFSEIHDLREYRPGDSMHEVHWKLSAKTDKLIVREAEEPDLGLVVLSFDFSGSRAQLDRTLQQLLWLSGWLCEREVAHQIDWLEPDTLTPQTRRITSAEDLQALLQTLLSTHLTGDTPSIAGRVYSGADWRYHIGLQQEVDA